MTTISKKQWLDIVDELDAHFPKGRNKSRGAAMVLLAKVFNIIGIKVDWK